MGFDMVVKRECACGCGVTFSIPYEYRDSDLPWCKFATNECQKVKK